MQNYLTNYNLPDNKGHFEEYGGKFVPETLIPALHELEKKYLISKKDDLFQKELSTLLKEYSVGILTVVIKKQLIKNKKAIFDTNFDMLSDMDFILKFSIKKWGATSIVPRWLSCFISPEFNAAIVPPSLWPIK